MIGIGTQRGFVLQAKLVDLGDTDRSLAWIAQIFDFDKRDLGRTLLDIATTEILVSMDAEQDPDGMPWPQLSQRYIEYKAEIAPQAPMAVLHGLMKNWTQVAGEQYVYRTMASMTYGVDPAARVEAVKFSEGGIVTGTNQPPRPFYALTTSAVAKITDMLDEMFRSAW